ncbi:MAG: hypothetical protein ACPGWR_26115 [Ardenticatenaceae bacterium]
MAKKKRKPSKKKSKRSKVPTHFKPTVKENEVVAKEEPVKVEPPAPPVAPVELSPPMDDEYEYEEDEDEDEDEEMGYDSRFLFYSHAETPTRDWFEGRDLNSQWNLGEALDNFVFSLEDHQFLTWEAVIRREKGLPLSRRQKQALSNLLYFGDYRHEPIWYIDEFARPEQTWYEIARQIAPHLLQKEPIYTSVIPREVVCDGWSDLAGAIEEHAGELSLPKGVNTPLDIFPRDLFHRLELQACFDSLRGLGQQKELNLEDQPWRLSDFVDELRESKASVAYLDLTLEKLLTKVVLPPNDEKIFVQEMMEELNLTSPQEPLAKKL